MHICFLDGHYPNSDGTGGGGAGWYIKMIGAHHIKNGYNVTVLKVTPNHFKQDYIDNNGINVIHYQTSSFFLTQIAKISFFHFLVRPLAFILHSLIAYKAIIKINSDFKIDIIETVDGGNIVLSLFNKIPYVEHIHCSQYSIKKECAITIDLGTKLERILHLRSLQNAGAVISPSKAMLMIVEKEYGREIIRKRKIPLCISKPEIKIKNVSNKIKFIFASRNDPLKGGETLIKAIIDVNRSYYNKVEFHFIGYIPNKQESLPSNVIINEFLPRDQLLEYYHKCDVALLPSLFDNSPLFIYETMAAGLPVIATNVGGIPELVKHGETGLLFDVNDINRLVSHIITLIENPKHRKEMGANAQNFIFNYASVDKIAKQKLRLYRNIIEENNHDAI